MHKSNAPRGISSALLAAEPSGETAEADWGSVAEAVAQGMQAAQDVASPGFGHCILETRDSGNGPARLPIANFELGGRGSVSQIARLSIQENTNTFVLRFCKFGRTQGLKKEKHMVRANVWMKLLTSVLLTAATAFPQSSEQLPVTDAEKIVDALRAGPAFITRGATVLDWPSARGGEYRLLRKGSNEWTCLPAIPGYPHDEPGCFDPIFLRWMQDSLAGRTPHIDRVGVSYMSSMLMNEINYCIV